MEEDTSVHATELDVLCGRGNARHPGNARFRRIVADHHERYPASVTKHDKMKVSKMILVEVLSEGDRFLRKDPIDCKWYVVDDKVAKDKISHCVREIKRGRRADRRQYPVARTQVHEEPALGGQPRQETAPWEVPSQEMLVGHQEHQQMLPSSIVDIQKWQRRNSEPYPVTVCNAIYPIWDQQMLPSSIVDIKHCQRRNSAPPTATVCNDIYPIWDQQMLPSSIVSTKHCERRNSEPPPATVCNDICSSLSSSSMGDITPYSLFPPEPLLTLDDARKLKNILTPSQQCQESETHSGPVGTSKRSSLNTQHDSRQASSLPGMYSTRLEASEFSIAMYYAICID